MVHSTYNGFFPSGSFKIGGVQRPAAKHCHTPRYVYGHYGIDNTTCALYLMAPYLKVGATGRTAI
jgi:hypothetical protein